MHATPVVCDLRARCVVGTRCGGWEIVPAWAWLMRVLMDPASVACIRSNGGWLHAKPVVCALRARCVVGTRCGGWEIVPAWAWGMRVLWTRLRLHASEATVALLHAKPVVCALRARCVVGTRCGAGRLCLHGRGEGVTCGHGFGCMHPKQRWRCCTLHQWFVPCALGVLWARGAGLGDCACMGVGNAVLWTRLRLHASEATVALLHATPVVCALRARCVVGTRCGGWEIVPAWAWGMRVLWTRLRLQASEATVGGCICQWPAVELSLTRGRSWGMRVLWTRLRLHASEATVGGCICQWQAVELSLIRGRSWGRRDLRSRLRLHASEATVGGCMCQWQAVELSLTRGRSWGRRVLWTRLRLQASEATVGGCMCQWQAVELSLTRGRSWGRRDLRSRLQPSPRLRLTGRLQASEATVGGSVSGSAEW